MKIEYCMLSVECLIPNINYLLYIIINRFIDKKSLIIIGMRSAENQESVWMTGFLHEHNEEIGVFWQALCKNNIFNHFSFNFLI